MVEFAHDALLLIYFDLVLSLELHQVLDRAALGAVQEEVLFFLLVQVSKEVLLIFI